MKKYLALFSLSLLLPSCKTIDYRNTIFVSVYPIYDFTKRIARDRYDIHLLTPCGQEPHDYEPTAREIGGLSDAPLLLLNGLGIDSWSESLPDSLAKKSRTVTDSIETKTINGVTDPHVWLSVTNAIKEMENIKDILSELSPENQEYFQNNYETEKKAFLELDRQYRDELRDLKTHYLVVSHAAFGYLEEYGLRQIYLSGLEPDSTPTAKQTEAIIESMKEYQITTVFYEETVSPDIAKAIAKETGAKTKTLNPLESLSEEDMKNKKDYLSIMKENLEKIKEANNDTI